MKRLGRDAAEITALADHLTAHGLALEMFAGHLSGIYGPTGPGKLLGEVLFAFFAAMAETERDNIRESTLEGLDTAARKGEHGGGPPVITNEMLDTVLRRRAGGESASRSSPTNTVSRRHARAAAGQAVGSGRHRASGCPCTAVCQGLRLAGYSWTETHQDQGPARPSGTRSHR
ncbi:recombinase family protein [Streptomyces albus subsp. chlorinus]|uniref:recombinase family protein n=1 Tax=Streptomyces albus TaxID=1888 RepID=UPI001FABB02D|nr:recombinase family protein [Streptomyces albus]